MRRIGHIRRTRNLAVSKIGLSRRDVKKIERAKQCENFGALEKESTFAKLCLIIHIVMS